MRKIPATMATQHPDNASAPYWEKDGDAFVSTREESQELYSCFKDLDCQEFMWDWEGKYVDEAVVDRLFHKYYDYFNKNQLGKDKFLTFRIPNIWHEKGYGLARAMMGILTADNFAKDLKFHTPPIFEVILPMTEKADDIIHIQKTFKKLSDFTSKLFSEKIHFNELNVLPLLEGVDNFINCKSFLRSYLQMYKKEFKRKPEYLRIHIARSDPAMNSGVVSAVVGGKVAISESYRFGEENKIKIFPAVGVGTLPFRGSLSPNRVGDFLKEYSGIRTVYIQSAFRYDHDTKAVKRAIAKLNRELPKTKVKIYSKKELAEAKKICEIFSPFYRQTVESIATTVHNLSKHVPSRRERKLHVGLFGYSRSIGKKKLPRAIPFTAVLYSLGIPPEFVGTGRGLKKAAEGGIDVEKYYVNLKKDLVLAGRCLNKENLEKLVKNKNGWSQIKKDIDFIEEILGITLGPKTDEDFMYRNHTSNFYFLWKNKASLSDEIIASGKIRKSLG